MSKRYSVDLPAYESDIEEDIGLEPLNVTDGDRQLLEADDEMMDLEGKKPKKSFFSREFFKGSSKNSRGGNTSSYNKLTGGSEFPEGGDDGAKSSNKNGNSRGQRGSRTNRTPTYNAEGLYDDSDLDSDEDEIAIDVRTRPNRRNPPRLFKFHVLGSVALLVGLYILYNAFLTSGQGAEGVSRPKTQKSLLSNGTHSFYPTTLVVSLDGFHPHYISEELTPNLHMMLTQKSGMPYMIPSFPSSTFPNHWTLVTGLYPKNHGIVGNTFWDSKLRKQFINTVPQKSLDPIWWGGEPIWQTAAFQGVSTAVHMWPGSEVRWREGAPIAVDPFNATETLPAKLLRFQEWIDTGDLETRPQLMLAYVPNVDTAGHAHGISGSELKQAINDVDTLVGSIRQSLEDRNLTDIVNLVVLSDHGMAPTSSERLIYIDDIIDLKDIFRVDGYPLIGLRPKNNDDLLEFYGSIKRVEPEDGSWKVYLNERLPEEWHFGRMSFAAGYGSRMAPIWIIPEVGWSVTSHEEMKKSGGVYKPYGAHGYDINEVLMRALFVAQGPYFGEGLFKPISNVNVYNILCDTLGVKPATNNGKPLGRVLEILPKDWSDSQEYPGVQFKTEVLDINSTYDILFKPENGTTSASKEDSGSKSYWATWWDAVQDSVTSTYDDIKGWISQKVNGDKS